MNDSEALEQAKQAARVAIASKRAKALKDAGMPEKKLSTEVLQALQTADSDFESEEEEEVPPPKPAPKTRKSRAKAPVAAPINLNEPVPIQVPIQAPIQVPTPPPVVAPSIKEKFVLDPELKQYVRDKVKKHVAREVLLFSAQQNMSSKPVNSQKSDALLLARLRLNQVRDDTIYGDLFPNTRRE
jgi:hypothetical protein